MPTIRALCRVVVKLYDAGGHFAIGYQGIWYPGSLSVPEELRHPCTARVDQRFKAQNGRTRD